MMKAFLSHTSVDKDLVAVVQKKLTTNNAWYDAVDIENGESIPEKINEGLRVATHYVLFWSEPASKSRWVRAELNSAFVRMLSDKCKFLLFTLDATPLPELLQPYKYDKIDKTDINAAANTIVDIILRQECSNPKLSSFVNRHKEIAQIEDAARDGYKLIILNGILGIGKSSLAEKALQWLYPNRSSGRIILDFSLIPGIAELCIELSRKTKTDLINDNSSEEKQKENIRYLLEVVSASKTLLILKDIKKWLNNDGTLSDHLRFITDIIVTTDMFDGITIATSSRYIEVPYEYYETTQQIPIQGMSDGHIANIIQNNLPEGFDSDDQKNYEFAKRLYGYPLGAKFGAFHIASLGYNYYLQQEEKIHSLKLSLAKQLISFVGISDECQNYLKILALSKSRLRNEECCQAFPEMSEQIAAFSDEAFFAGILKFDDDGCYKLEPLVEDYYYDLAFNAPERRDICKSLETFLLDALKETNTQDPKYLRLLPVAVHLLVLNNKVSDAFELRSELIETIATSMWDQYNHREYEDALATAEGLLSVDPENKKALYAKALCLTRFDEYNEAEKILNVLLHNDAGNAARYYYALGRIQERKSNYDEAIELFDVAAFEDPRYISPHREKAKCYIHMGELDKAQSSIDNAKRIDDSNVFVILLEARLLQKQGDAEKAIEILSAQSLLEQKPDEILFRKGRAYDQLGKVAEAKKCYNDALSYNAKMYDAKLCLLNHQIIDSPETAEKDIAELRGKLRGKRRAILTNIEARFVGYVRHDETHALDLLKSVKAEFKDRQWYAVKKQLLENAIEKHMQSGRTMLSQRMKEEVAVLCEEFEQKFGDALIEDIDLLPDS